MKSLTDKAIQQLEFNITLLRSLNDHKERSSWVPVIATTTIFGLILSMAIRELYTIIFVALLGNSIIVCLLIYIRSQDKIAQEANLIIRACRTLLVKIHSEEKKISSEDLKPGDNLNNVLTHISHPEWYPRIILEELNNFTTSSTLKLLMNMKIAIVLTNLIGLNIYIFFYKFLPNIK